MEGYGPIYDSTYIIDDDPVINMLHTRVIKNMEVSTEIRTFQNPICALEQLDDDLSKHLKRILVLLDINMPEMNGFEFLESTVDFQNLDFNLDIFMITSSVDPCEHQKVLTYPMVRKCIPKPFNAQILNDFIRSYGTVHI